MTQDAKRPQTALACLVEARRLIERPESWAKGYYAFDKRDRPVPSANTEAVKWCPLGAMLRADGPKLQQAADFLEGAIGPSWYNNVATFNDAPSTTHADVLAKFDEAIALAKAAGAA